MSTINYLNRMERLKVMNLKKFLVFIVVALGLQVAGVLNLDAVPLAASNATNIVAEQRIPTLLGVGLHCAKCMLITFHYRTVELFPFAEVVMARSPVRLAGLPQEKCFYCHLLMRKKERMKNDDVLTDLEKKILIGQKLGVFDDFAGRQLLKCFKHGIQDKFIVGQIEKRVTSAQRRLAKSGCPFLPHKLRDGDFIFGYDQWKNEIWTYVQYFNAHTLIVASTGTGKTNLSKYHAIQIAPLVRGLWLIDLRKREYRFLRPIFAHMGIDLKIIRGRKFCINPLEVAHGVEPVEHAAVGSDLLVRVLNLPPRASTLLKSTIIKLYKVHGILDGGDKYPTLFHLYEAVRTNKEANPQARRATLDSLEAILLAMGPEMLAYHRGWDVHELAQQHFVMELTGLPEAGKDLILNYLITAEFISRIARGISNPVMDLWISFDEGQRLFSKRKESGSYGGNALIDLTGLTRGTGIGLEISVLTTNDLSANIPNLTSTKIVGRCGSLAEYTTAGHFVGLNSEQITWCAHHMVPGLFVGQVGEGSWRYPFLFSVPLVKGTQRKGEHVSDQDADNSIKGMKQSRLLSARI